MASITLSAAEPLLHRLRALDVAYIFIGSDTNYPPVIEAWAKTRAAGQKVPELVICPHKNTAIGIAHGYYLGTDEVRAVMVRTSVELANTACGAINLANNNIPVLIFGGRTPISEHSHFGCRNTPIDYGQEMHDQTALIRESVKWDFELRLADQIGEHVDRAWAIANSLPKGPVYLSLPREPLRETFAIDEAALQAGPSQQPARYAPVREDITQAAEVIACARHPVIFAQRGARTTGGFARLNSLVREWAIPLVGYWGTRVTLSIDSPLLAGAGPSTWLADTDVTPVIDSQAPWMIAEGDCRQDCTVIQMGPDPLFSRYPIRSYRADINLVGEIDEVFDLLEETLHPLQAARQQHMTERMACTQHRVQQQKNQRNALLHAGQTGVITRPWLSYCPGHLANQHRGRIVSELTTLSRFAGLTHAKSYYQEMLAGGLDEALPIALGLQLAHQEELVITVVGGGSYLFASPAVCHHIAEVVELPVLIVIENNGGWDAVAGSTRALYPDGYAAHAGTTPTIALTTSPDFAAIAASSHAAALSVSRAEDLPGILGETVSLIHTR